MFFAAQLHLTRAQVEQKFSTAKERWGNKELQWLQFTSSLTAPATRREQGIFLQEFFDFVGIYQGKLSQPAQVNIALWFNYLHGNS